MINKIHIAATASFGQKPAELTDLKATNFIYGSNGSGKTTISQVIAGKIDSPECHVTWQGEVALETFVYNRFFVADNFEQSPDVPGVFTLGEEDKSAIEKIKAAKSDVDELGEKISGLKSTLEGNDGGSGKRSDLRELEAGFENKVWGLKQRYDETLRGAFTGYRDSKSKFRDHLLEQFKSNTARLDSLVNAEAGEELEAKSILAELERRAITVFGQSPEEVDKIPVPEYDDLPKLESEPILKKTVVGKADVDITAMIKKLGNSDWVRQGLTFLEANDGSCPFCQQTTDASFSASLGEYFDETFESDTTAIENFCDDYQSHADRLKASLHRSLASSTRFLDLDKLKSETELLESKIRTNQERIQTKRDEPSRSVKLDSLSDVLTAIRQLIEVANGEISDHNRMVGNLSREKRDLTAQVWKYLLEYEVKSDLAVYRGKKNGLTRAIDRLTEQIEAKEKAKRDREAEIRDLEKATTSIQPTIDEINKLLRSFGFDNFELRMADIPRYYKIVRSDGTDAKETLSEGEKNFITFLYFYHLISGSTSESGMMTDRVIVFDDPVCSLDSDLLFIVSHLISGIQQKTIKGTSNNKQVFVLTHNVYFHKEVTLVGRGMKGGSRSFWIVAKPEGVSQLKQYQENPITTSYALLW